MLPAPTVAAAGTLAFRRLRERASCRCSLPFGPILSNRVPPVRFAASVRPASRCFLFGSAFGRAAPAGSGRMGLAVAGAVAACCALPRFGLLRACFLLRSFGHRSLGRRACAPCLRTDRPAGQKRALPRGSGVLPLAPLPLDRAPGLATIGPAASALLRDAIPASGTGLSGLQSALYRARLSTLELVSMQTFQSGPIRKFLLSDQRLAALSSNFVSLSTRQMLRLVPESHKRKNAKLSTGSPRTGGQLRKPRKRPQILIRAGLSARAAPAGAGD